MSNKYDCQVPVEEYNGDKDDEDVLLKNIRAIHWSSSQVNAVLYSSIHLNTVKYCSLQLNADQTAQSN